MKIIHRLLTTVSKDSQFWQLQGDLKKNGFPFNPSLSEPIDQLGLLLHNKGNSKEKLSQWGGLNFNETHLIRARIRSLTLQHKNGRSLVEQHTRRTDPGTAACKKSRGSFFDIVNAFTKTCVQASLTILGKIRGYSSGSLFKSFQVKLDTLLSQPEAFETNAASYKSNNKRSPD